MSLFTQTYTVEPRYWRLGRQFVLELVDSLGRNTERTETRKLSLPPADELNVTLTHANGCDRNSQDIQNISVLALRP